MRKIIIFFITRKILFLFLKMIIRNKTTRITQETKMKITTEIIKNNWCHFSRRDFCWFRIFAREKMITLGIRAHRYYGAEFSAVMNYADVNLEYHGDAGHGGDLVVLLTRWWWPEMGDEQDRAKKVTAFFLTKQLQMFFFFFCCFRLHNKVFSHTLLVNYLSIKATKVEI